MTLHVWPLPGIPEVRPGDDLARLLLEAVARAGLALADGDVLAVTSKVVAKAEGRTVPLPSDPAARERALAETVAAETARVVARRGRLVIAETRTGLVGANALVDASNAGGDRLVLLPSDPDASAARLRAELQRLDGHDVAVVITDTLGRPWRLGQTDVAVGLAGMGALDDWRGRADGDGRLLEVTEVAVADSSGSSPCQRPRGRRVWPPAPPPRRGSPTRRLCWPAVWTRAARTLGWSWPPVGPFAPWSSGCTPLGSRRPSSPPTPGPLARRSACRPGGSRSGSSPPASSGPPVVPGPLWPGGCGGSRRGNRRRTQGPSRPGTATRSACPG